MVDNGEVQYNPNVVRLIKHINDEPSIILINVGSSHNFLSQEMVEKANL
jgi:predicted AAA+ superfamily ATPase